VILRGPGGPHLTYCTNIHPGESWAEVRHNLERYVVPVADALGVRPFGVGLRLSGQAARELARPPELAALRDLLAKHDLYVFTLNGFPYGAFHGQRVKEQVYLPDWLDDERLRYTNQLAELLAALLPLGVEGSVSTVPGAFRTRVDGSADEQRMAERMVDHVAFLCELRRRTGRRINLALEPEPCCQLETLAEAAAFFREHLFSERSAARLAERTGLAPAAAAAALRRHLTVCLDACHAAVEFESLDAALSQLEAVGVRVGKIQLSSGLRIPRVDAHTPARLAPFADDVYLHQVVDACDGRLARHVDLPDALAAARQYAPDEAHEWRIHFHVPVFLERFAAEPGQLESTQPFLAELLERQKRAPFAPHLEVETYTWDVLPEAHRTSDVASAVARELRWVLERL
jgi:hypothetical protein